MRGSLERVRAVIHGQMPDRPPLYDLLRNDAVLSHFAGETLTIENRESVVDRAYEPALDATRPPVRRPLVEETVWLPDGREERRQRWTVWTEPAPFHGTDAYAASKRAWLDADDPSWTAGKEADGRNDLAFIEEERRRLGEVFFFPIAPGVRLMRLYEEIGLDRFALCMADCPDILDELLERQTLFAIDWAAHLPGGHGLDAVFVGDDLAFKTGPLFSPRWLRKAYFPRLARVIAAYHARGLKVMFHSDGNLNMILEDLVAAGIDGLNPIEVFSGMDVGDIHRRHPHLFLAGGIDVTHLLPFGKPSEIQDAVKRTLDAAEGRLMVGSSTELHNDVPLENYLALREAVLNP